MRSERNSRPAKRVLSLILSVLMLWSLLPNIVMASGNITVTVRAENTNFLQQVDGVGPAWTGTLIDYKVTVYVNVIICLVLLAFGISKSEINKKLGISYPTLRKYKSALDTGKIDELLEFKSERTKSELDKYEALILKNFDENPPKTLRETQTRIEQLTGLKRSLNRIRVWLKKRGFVPEQ